MAAGTHSIAGTGAASRVAEPASQACVAAEGAVSSHTMKRLNDRDTFLVLAVVAVATAGLLYALRSRGPVRVVPSSEADVVMVSGRTSLPVRPWRAVIIHQSGTLSGNAAYLDRVQSSGGSPHCVAFHFLIGNGRGASDGEIQVGSRWRRQAPSPSVTGAEGEAINVCLVGDFVREPPTRAQMASLGLLLRHLQWRFNLPQRCVRLHREADPGYTQCPGDHLSLDALRPQLLR